jgi:hypothetical protein
LTSEDKCQSSIIFVPTTLALTNHFIRFNQRIFNV